MYGISSSYNQQRQIQSLEQTNQTQWPSTTPQTSSISASESYTMSTSSPISLKSADRRLSGSIWLLDRSCDDRIWRLLDAGGMKLSSSSREGSCVLEDCSTRCMALTGEVEGLEVWLTVVACDGLTDALFGVGFIGRLYVVAAAGDGFLVGPPA